MSSNLLKIQTSKIFRTNELERQFQVERLQILSRHRREITEMEAEQKRRRLTLSIQLNQHKVNEELKKEKEQLPSASSFKPDIVSTERQTAKRMRPSEVNSSFTTLNTQKCALPPVPANRITSKELISKNPIQLAPARITNPLRSIINNNSFTKQKKAKNKKVKMQNQRIDHQKSSGQTNNQPTLTSQ